MGAIGNLTIFGFGRRALEAYVGLDLDLATILTTLGSKLLLGVAAVVGAGLATLGGGGVLEVAAVVGAGFGVLFGTAATLGGDTVIGVVTTGLLGLGTVFTLGGATVSAGLGHGVFVLFWNGILLGFEIGSVGSWKVTLRVGATGSLMMGRAAGSVGSDNWLGWVMLEKMSAN